MTISALKPSPVATAKAFSAGEKKPAEAGFSQDHYDSLSAAIPCLWSIIRDPEHFLCFG
ncbi:hypothetical protein [Pseudomonas sp. 460]|uniref:hypothetical protein n=1 Tax=Pseudomonas sp. 460 TaxID=2485142 RepID=UPI001314ABD9|nr:hypothetical protein [Pseudomonas sp. 460]